MYISNKAFTKYVQKHTTGHSARALVVQGATQLVQSQAHAGLLSGRTTQPTDDRGFPPGTGRFPATTMLPACRRINEIFLVHGVKHQSCEINK